MRNKLPTLIYVILVLAGIGLISQLFGNTKNFLINVFSMIVIGLAVFTAIYFIFFRKKSTSHSEMKKYKNAVKQSKSKYKQRHVNDPKKKQPPLQTKQRKKLKKRASHLRVIDGKKHNEKDRASY